jgi:hypothetical protein
MSVTAYCALSESGLQSVGPPAVMGLLVNYQLVDTVANAAIPCANGNIGASITVPVTCPVTSQNSVLPTCTQAIQAAEPNHPGLSFIWMGL